MKTCFSTSYSKVTIVYYLYTYVLNYPFFITFLFIYICSTSRNSVNMWVVWIRCWKTGASTSRPCPRTAPSCWTQTSRTCCWSSPTGPRPLGASLRGRSMRVRSHGNVPLGRWGNLTYIYVYPTQLFNISVIKLSLIHGVKLHIILNIWNYS